MTKKLFLTWCLTSMITIAILFIALYSGQQRLVSLNIIGQVMIGAILVVGLLSHLHAAKLCWKADKDLSLWSGKPLLDRLDRVAHESQHLSFASNICPYIGFLGAVTGIFIFMSNGLSSDPNKIKEILATSMSGIGVAFLPTIVGVFFFILLAWDHHYLNHHIRRFK